MKRITYIFIGMSVSLLTMTATFGQNGTEVPRLTAEEQAAFEKSIAVNPAKLPEGNLSDPKQDPSTAVQQGPVNWKPDAAVEDMRVAEGPDRPADPKSPEQAGQSGNSLQPEGEKPVSQTQNRREMQGPRNQPEGEKSSNVTSRRLINGPKSQPEGEKPKR